MKPRDVIHHENAHALDAVCNSLGHIALPVYVIPIVFRERLQEKPVFSTIVSSERVIAVRAGGKAHSCNLRNGFGSVVVPLIKVRHIRAHLFHSLDHHAIDFADVRAEDEVLFDPANQIRRNRGMGIEEFGFDPKVAQRPEPGQLVDFSECRTDDEDGLDFSPAMSWHRSSRKNPPLMRDERHELHLSPCAVRSCALPLLDRKSPGAPTSTDNQAAN